jgi:4-hydroxy-tetrahydrodipicolinate reductase
MTEIKLGVVGCAGRMGQMLVREIAATPGARLAGGTERAGSPALGRDIGELAGLGANGVKIEADPLPLFGKSDVVLDFTSPAASVAHAGYAAQAKCGFVVGTTGLDKTQEEALARAARHTPIVYAANMSVGVNLLAALVRRAASVLGEDYDIEVLEMHHRHKVDAPSGTALFLGRAAAAGRDVALDAKAVRSRDGHTGARPKGAIGFATLRGGDVVGDHTVIFAAEGERLELGHRAGNRGLFARGAVRAALWAKGRPPGLYGMADVLGLA